MEQQGYVYIAHRGDFTKPLGLIGVLHKNHGECAKKDLTPEQFRTIEN